MKNEAGSERRPSDGETDSKSGSSCSSSSSAGLLEMMIGRSVEIGAFSKRCDFQDWSPYLNS